jgi:uncharacterized protein (DUF1499 family)
MGRRMLIGPAVGLLVIGGLGLALRLYMSREAEDRLYPDEAVVISALKPPLPGNAALACPPDYCAVAEAIPNPVFAVHSEQLLDNWIDVISKEPRVVMVASDLEQRRFSVIQHSALLRFPDIVTVEFIPLEGDRSSLAVYSRARYGRSDFGVNRKRVLRWLDRLQAAVGQ